MPLAIIVGTIFFIRANYINDSPPQSISLNTYLVEQNPVVIPIGSSNLTFLNKLKTSLKNQYGVNININADTTDTLPKNFDQQYLSPLKKTQPTLKGGIYFLPSTTVNSNN